MTRAATWVAHQCDQMTWLFDQHLAIHSSEHLPSSIKNCNERSNFLSNTKQTLHKIAKDF